MSANMSSMICPRLAYAKRITSMSVTCAIVENVSVPADHCVFIDS